MIRAFLGIALPDAIRSALVVQQFLLPLPRRVPAEQLHLTLVFLGELRPETLEHAHERFLTLSAAAFDLSLSGLGLFGGDRPRAAWAGVAESVPLRALQAKVERLADEAGCAVEHRRFVPHVTLGRFSPPPLAQSFGLERAIADGAAFRAGPWRVNALTMWQSHLGPKAVRYEQLADYPLRGA